MRKEETEETARQGGVAGMRTILPFCQARSLFV